MDRFQNKPLDRIQPKNILFWTIKISGQIWIFGFQFVQFVIARQIQLAPLCHLLVLAYLFLLSILGAHSDQKSIWWSLTQLTTCNTNSKLHKSKQVSYINYFQSNFVCQICAGNYHSYECRIGIPRSLLSTKLWIRKLCEKLSIEPSIFKHI